MNDTYESFEDLYMDLALVIAYTKVRFPDRMEDIEALVFDTRWVKPDLKLVINNSIMLEYLRGGF